MPLNDSRYNHDAISEEQPSDQPSNSSNLDSTRAHNRKEKERMRKQLRENAQRLQVLEQRMQSLSSEVAIKHSPSSSNSCSSNSSSASSSPSSPSFPKRTAASTPNPNLTHSAFLLSKRSRDNTANFHHKELELKPRMKEPNLLRRGIKHNVLSSSATGSTFNTKSSSTIINICSPLKLHQSTSDVAVDHIINEGRSRNTDSGCGVVAKPNSSILDKDKSPIDDNTEMSSPTPQNMLTSPDSLGGIAGLPDSFNSNIITNQTSSSSATISNNLGCNVSFNDTSSFPSLSFDSFGNPLQFVPTSVATTVSVQDHTSLSSSTGAPTFIPAASAMELAQNPQVSLSTPLQSPGQAPQTRTHSPNIQPPTTLPQPPIPYLHHFQHLQQQLLPNENHQQQLHQINHQQQQPLTRNPTRRPSWFGVPF